MSTRTTFNRRQFMSVSTAAAAGTGLFGGLVARQRQAKAAVGYGPLEAKGPELKLPPGFNYKVISRQYDVMDDGYPVHHAVDGMAALPGAGGKVRLIRNHEDRNTGADYRRAPLTEVLATKRGPRDMAYDQFAGGGCTSFDFDPVSKTVSNQHWSLVGTTINCAGGKTPWGSWISCEETTVNQSATSFAKPHGFSFEVPGSTSVDDVAVATPILALGRFAKEALAVHPRNLVIYQTEDAGNNSGLYRWMPPRQWDPISSPLASLAANVGRFQMLSIPGVATAIKNQPLGEWRPVEWVNIANRNPASPSFTGGTAVAAQGAALGGTLFNRLEGIWHGNDRFYFHSTQGGNAGFGQVWEYDADGARLRLLFESPGPAVLDAPDNICVSPRGGLVLCEDGGGVQFLRGLTPAGEIFDFALNIKDEDEFAGACFSPDGQYLFVNLFGPSTELIQTIDGVRQVVVRPSNEWAMTVVIWGPWGQGLL